MKHQKQKPKKHGRLLKTLLLIGFIGVCTLIVVDLIACQVDRRYAIEKFARANDLALSDYPESIIELYERNRETKDFVFNYPLEVNEPHPIDMSEFRNPSSVPLFIQWDKRWGYLQYGDDVAGLTACGPMCLAMAGYYITEDEYTFRPDHVMEFAERYGYYEPGAGSTWTLISEGARRLGLDVTEIPLDEDRIIRNLQVDNPIVCVVGPGVFTTTGHFIVLTGYEGGKYRVNDPNSVANSQKLWTFDEFSDQIQALWVLRDFYV